jgi:NADPH-dependent 2,4-dienoyl-CoA reductase/sulfur reductase-like enzyme
VDLHLGCKAVKLDPSQYRVVDDQNGEYGFEKLLIATGGRPRHLPFEEEGILYFRYLKDFKKLKEYAEKYNKFSVIGGGFIGSEIAAALAMNDKNVTIIFPEVGIGGLQFPEDLAKDLNDYYRQNCVRVLNGHQVKGIGREGDQWILETDQDRELTAEVVLAGIGIRPNTDLAAKAGLKVKDGIMVDPSLRTSHQDIFAAGDVARFYNPGLSKDLRVEHEDNALTMGEMAGRSMAGEDIEYDYLPYFYSDLFDCGYEAVGELNPDYEIISDWQESYQKGVVYYLDESRVRGVLLWNVWGKVDDARNLIYEPGLFGKLELKGRLQD